MQTPKPQDRMWAMLPLRDYQAAMTDYVTSSPGPDVPEALCGLLGPGASHAEKRFIVYKNNFYSRLVDALRETFPVVVRLVGDEFFRFAAKEYAARTPPRVATLLTYGEAFAEFLAEFPPASGIPYLADVARLEFLYLESYHAPDPEWRSRDMIATGADGIRPVLHPSARFMTSPFQVSRIWELNRGEAPFDNVILPELREYLLVIRPGREVEVRRLRFGAYAALLAFADGASVAEARKEAGQAEPDLDFPLHYAALASGGTFTDIFTGVQPV